MENREQQLSGVDFNVWKISPSATSWPKPSTGRGIARNPRCQVWVIVSPIEGEGRRFLPLLLKYGERVIRKHAQEEVL
jgi:hypothetical protein